MLLDEPIKPMAKSSLKRYQRKTYCRKLFIKIHEFEKAWQSLFLWMNENGYQYKRTFPF